tara:strand:- start:114 stop:425 length:312 start_codon:yes stop_codon:yes gene_type:complete
LKEIFFIPDKSERDNEITPNDIKLNQLRVGVNNKKYFTNEDCTILIVFNEEEYICPFRIRNKDGKSRSYTIQIGEQLMNLLSPNKNTILEFHKIDMKKYNIIK